MAEPAIKVENIEKVFRLPHERQSSLKSTLINFRKRGYEMQRALENVSFEVKAGEFFGIVGRNGSGKSTLLKMLAGIYEPTKGSIKINGSLTPFIELGVGFNQELSGRENVFLNGALLGFNRKQMAAMYDEIVEFAELERFMDQKLKNYSSGMQVRLAFSIAIRAHSDILLLDEVLAVGDEAFQKKCMNIFDQHKANKQTIVLVTHNMAIVEKYCTRAMMIDNGRIEAIGDPVNIAWRYSSLNQKIYADERAKDEQKLSAAETVKRFEKTAGIKYEITNAKGQATHDFKHGQTATVKVSWRSDKIKNIGVAIVKKSGEYIFGTNTDAEDITIKTKSLGYQVDLNIDEGEYRFVIGFFGETDKDKLYFAEKDLYFNVSRNRDRWGGLVSLPHKWRS